MSPFQHGPPSKIEINEQDSKEGVLTGCLTPTQKEDKRSISESSRLECATEKPWRMLGLGQRQGYLCAGNFNLSFFNFYFFLTQVLLTFRLCRWNLSKKPGLQKLSGYLLCDALFQVLLSGYFQAVLTDYTVIWLPKWYEIEHCTLNSSGQTQKRFVKLWLSNCKWSIFHSLITECLCFEWWEVIIYTLTSSPNCKVKEVNLNHEDSFNLDVSQQQKDSELWWLQITNFSSQLEKLSVDVVSLHSSASKKQLAKPQEPSCWG